MAGRLPPERSARLAGSASAIGALTLVVWVPLFIGPDPLATILVFGVGTIVLFGAVETAAVVRQQLADRTGRHGEHTP